jgi:KRAB domain-containing zinc finger protein
MNTKKVNFGKRFVCVWPQCLFETKYSTCLRRHLSTHWEERKYKFHYKTCHKRLKLLNDLEEHKLIHWRVKKFLCDWNRCFMKFKPKTVLINNKNSVHLNIKPFECNYNGCHRRFSNWANFINHPRIHSEEKPFICH